MMRLIEDKACAVIGWEKTSFLLDLTSRFTEVQFPRKFRPREDFSSNRSSELKNPNRAEEIYRAEIGFGNFTSRVKFLLMPVRRG